MTDLDLYQPPAALPAPRDTDSWIAICSDVIKLANVIYDTDFVPKGLRGSAPATAAAILAGREMGLGPMTSLQHIHVVNGKPGQSALLMRSLIIGAGHHWQDVDISDARAVVRGRRKGESDWAEASFTADQAKKAGIQLGGYPQDKLYARATVRLARRKFADVIVGMPYSAEELEDGVIEDGAGDSTLPPAPAPIDGRRTARRTAAPDSPPPPARRPLRAVQPPARRDGMPPLPGEPDLPAPARGETAADGPPDTTPPSGNGHGSGPAASSSLGAAGPPAPPGLVGVIQAHFKRLGFEAHDRDERLVYTARLAGIDQPVDSSNDLTRDQAATVADALSRCRTRDQLVLLATSGETP